MHRFFASLLACIVLAAILLPTPATAVEPGSDAKAIALAEATVEAMGGQDAWNATHHICFTFVHRRHHCWDKYTGDHRMSLEDEGKQIVVLQNVNRREGEVYVDGQAQSGDTKQEWLDNAYGAWINDTYWLVMPYKLLDPGVTLTYDRAEEIDGTLYDVLKLQFQNVGLTPGDTYWAFLDRETGLMGRWEYHLQSYGADDPPTGWNWTGWAPHGDILLAPGRKNDAGRELPLTDIAVYDALPEAVYASAENVELP